MSEIIEIYLARKYGLSSPKSTAFQLLSSSWVPDQVCIAALWVANLRTGTLAL